MLVHHGSPPRVWGQLGIPRMGKTTSRFTPTCVGTTRPRTAGRYRRSVHPHVCGDNSPIGLPVDSTFGSPPRVWGQPALPEWFCRGRRFTPTCVGTTPSSRLRKCEETVHPHVCGDNIDGFDPDKGIRGSPPRVWGQRCPQRRRSDPRGSPPRVWGQPVMCSTVASRPWFTPTCVGTTCRIVPERCMTAVHPHVCGDNVDDCLERECDPGSPPRVWGQPSRQAR